jgi:cardiolipin synthase
VSPLDLAFFGLPIAVQAAGVLAALHAARRTHTAQGAVAWAIVLVAFPWAALPLYALFGPPDVTAIGAGRAEARAAAMSRRPDLAARRAPAPDARAARRRDALERLAPTPVLATPAPCLLMDGAETFDAILAAIDAAERTIFAQFYIVRDDRIGRTVRDRLIAKARAGVQVLFLYDAVGARNAPQSYWRPLIEAGADVRGFSLTHRRPKALRLNFRNHRKIVAVDGRGAILGGPNVGDEYLGRDPAFGPWRDTAIRLEGPAAAAVEAVFVEDWLWNGGPTPAPSAAPAVDAPGPRVPALILPTGPADSRPACALAFLHLIASARERFWIASPYFTPDLDVMNALKLAALRGVDVRVLIPARPDHRLVWAASFAYAAEALEAGVSVWRYAEGFMHQNVLLVDDWAAAVGTANLDTRSLRLNFEITTVVFDESFAARIAAMLEADFARSRREPPDAMRRYGVMMRLFAPGARLFAPLL